MLRCRSCFAALAICGTLVGCGTKQNPGPSTASCDQTANVSFASQIQPLLERYCTSCHSTAVANRNGAPVTINFDSYTAAAANADRANTRIQAGTMPPANANHPVTDTDKCLFQAWVDQGATQN